MWVIWIVNFFLVLGSSNVILYNDVKNSISSKVDLSGFGNELFNYRWLIWYCKCLQMHNSFKQFVSEAILHVADSDVSTIKTNPIFSSFRSCPQLLRCLLQSMCHSLPTLANRGQYRAWLASCLSTSPISPFSSSHHAARCYYLRCTWNKLEVGITWSLKCVKLCFVDNSSVENQKGINAHQRCSRWESAGRCCCTVLQFMAIVSFCILNRTLLNSVTALLALSQQIVYNMIIYSCCLCGRALQCISLCSRPVNGGLGVCSRSVHVPPDKWYPQWLLYLLLFQAWFKLWALGNLKPMLHVYGPRRLRHGAMYGFEITVGSFFLFFYFFYSIISSLMLNALIHKFA